MPPLPPPPTDAFPPAAPFNALGPLPATPALAARRWLRRYRPHLRLFLHLPNHSHPARFYAVLWPSTGGPARRAAPGTAAGTTGMIAADSSNTTITAVPTAVATAAPAFVPVGAFATMHNVRTCATVTTAAPLNRAFRAAFVGVVAR